MTDKELRRLRRDDLLQILINQQRQLDEAAAALEKSRQALEKRDIAVQEAGSVAEAALRLNGVFESAQAAVDQYSDQMRARADALVAEAEKKVADAQRIADDVLSSARGEADRILRQARSDAERLLAEGGARPEPAPVESAPSAPEADEGKKRRGLLWRGKKS